MRKAILPLLLIITMALTVSVASATDYTGTGAISDENGWSPTGTGTWVNSIDMGLTTASSASASHDVATGASGEFHYDVAVKLYDASNGVLVGLKTIGKVEHTLEFRGGHVWVDGTSDAGPITISAGDDTHIKFDSTDGLTWHYDIDMYQGDISAGDIPGTIEIGLTNNAGASGPVIYSVSFSSPGAPAIDLLPKVSTNDSQMLQNFYSNIYPKLMDPGANTGLTPSDPTKHIATVTVTDAANGKPIAGASVELGDMLKKTDSDGVYKFKSVAEGSADIAVSADGYASKTQTIDVKDDMAVNVALNLVSAGGSAIASAANETTNATAANVTKNVTVTPTMAPTTAPTTAPSATQTKSPGFEGIMAAIAMIGALGILVYVNRKR